ncbi:MAG: hypothetical protein ACHQF3_11395 [Alphaproteobacteria bacterium]
MIQAAAVICVALARAPAGHAEDYLVARGAFAGSIEGREPMQAVAPPARAAPGPLWFWTEIRVAASALAALRADKALPLQHRWYADIAGMPGPDLQPDFSRPLEMIDEEKLQRLAGEAKARGFFTYRTASCRANLREGHWIVAVTDANGRTLACADGRMCRFEVDVRAGGERATAPCPVGQ